MTLYSPTTWIPGLPPDGTEVTAARLNKGEQGIKTAQDTANTALAAATADTLPGASTVGKAVVKAVDAAAARTAISAVGQGTLVINVADAPYNAVGNGVADDTTAINAAITAANAAKGGTVFLPGTHKITSSLDCSFVTDVALQGTTRGRTTGSGIVWAGADNGSVIKANDASGFAIKGVSFTSSSVTFAGRHIDFSGTTAMPQAFHILIEWCFFAGGGGVLHTDIETGGGHNYTIRGNQFYKSNIAIMGGDAALSPAQAVQSCLVERNWFQYCATAEIVNPGSGWKITCNAVEGYNSPGGPFVTLTGLATLVNVTIEDNWCGDVSYSGSMIDMAGGPFTIRNNLLGVWTGGVAIRAVGIVHYCHIEDNRTTGSGAVAFIDWGAFTHGSVDYKTHGSGTIWVTGNEVPDGFPISAGTVPAKLITDAGGALTFTSPPMASLAITSGAVVIDASVNRGGAYISLSAAAVTSMTIVNPVMHGQILTITLRQNGAGTQTSVWPANVIWSPGTTAPTCTGAYGRTIVTLQWDSAGAGAGWVEVSRSTPPVSTGGGGSADVQKFLTSGTWTKPAGATTVCVQLVSSGGGGGSGRRGAAGTVRCGGGGGCGGSYAEIIYQAALLPSTVAVTVSNVGGAGGAAQTVNDTDGVAGGSLIPTIFGSYAAAGYAGGGFGAGGTATAGGGGGPLIGQYPGGNGGNASTTGFLGAPGVASTAGAGGGGAGGGISATDVASAGGNGGYQGKCYGIAGGVVKYFGTTGGAIGANGSDGATQPANTPWPGTGSSGGGSSITGVGGNGGNGGNYGGPGGGGGASLNGNNSGAGGNGGPGIAVITSY